MPIDEEKIDIFIKIFHESFAFCFVIVYDLESKSMFRLKLFTTKKHWNMVHTPNVCPIATW